MTAEAETAGAASTPKPRISRRTIIIGVAAAVVLVGGGSAYLLLGPSKHAEPTAEMPAAPQSFIFNLPTMTVNLKSDGKADEFMEFLRRSHDRLPNIARLDTQRSPGGMMTQWVETGEAPGFEPAWRLYERAGFAQRGAFLDYPDSGWSRFYEKRLRVAA